MLFLPWSFTRQQALFYFHWIAWWCLARLFAETHFIIKREDQREFKCGKRGVWKVTSGFLVLEKMSLWVAGDILSLDGGRKKLQFRVVCVWKVALTASGVETSRTHRDGKHRLDLPFSILLISAECWFSIVFFRSLARYPRRCQKFRQPSLKPKFNSTLSRAPQSTADTSARRRMTSGAIMEALMSSMMARSSCNIHRLIEGRTLTPRHRKTSRRSSAPRHISTAVFET